MHSALSWGVVLALWWITSLAVDNAISLPDPWSTLSTLWHLLGTEKFQDHIASSLADLSLSWLLCCTTLILICFVMLASDHCRIFLANISAGWQSTPTFAMAPIIIMSFGYNKTSVLLCMAWGVIWYAINHLAADVAQAKHHWGRQCENLQWNRFKQFVLIFVPALLPSFALVAKNSWSMMWRTLIAIEILFGAMSGSYGLGSFMNETRQQLFVMETWSAMLVIVFLGVTINKIFDVLLTQIDWQRI